MRRSRCAVGALFILASAAQAVTLEGNFGQYLIEEGNEFEILGLWGIAEVEMTGGEITDRVDRYFSPPSSGVNGSVWLTDSASFRMSGGLVQYAVFAYGASSLMFEGGQVRLYTTLRHDASLSIAGGEFLQDINTYNQSTVYVSGGDLAGGIRAYDDSALTIVGGSIPRQVVLNDQASMSIAQVDELESVYLKDDAVCAIEASYYEFDHDGAFSTPPVFLDVPEGAGRTIERGDPLLISGGGEYLAGFSPTWAHGVSTSSIMALNNLSFGVKGGQYELRLVEPSAAFYRQHGGVGTLDGAGPERTAHTSGDALLTLDGGTLQGRLRLFDDSVIDVMGATVRGDVVARDRSHLGMSDGETFGPVYITDEASLQVSGGSLRGAMYLDGSSETTLSGGTLKGALRLYGDADGTVSGATLEEFVQLYGDSSLVLESGEFQKTLQFDNASSFTQLGGTVFGRSKYLNGAHGRLLGGEAGSTIECSGTSTLELGGDATVSRIRMLFGPAPALRMSGGVVRDQLEIYGVSTAQIDDGSIMGSLDVSSQGDVVVNGGSVSATLVKTGGGAMQIHGGSFHGACYFSGDGFLYLRGGSVPAVIESGYGEGALVVEARSFAYDDDGDDATPLVPIDFGGVSELVLTRDDPEFIDFVYQEVATRAIHDLTVDWGDGTGAEFTFVTYGPSVVRSGSPGWLGTVVLRLVVPADLDNDGIVDQFDLSQLLAQWGECDGCSADLNGDGVVDAGDLALMIGTWGA